MRWFISATTLFLTACAEFPQLDGTIDDVARNAPYPGLINIDDITAMSPATNPDTAGLQSRIDALNAKANSLRAQPISN